MRHALVLFAALGLSSCGRGEATESASIDVEPDPDPEKAPDPEPEAEPEPASAEPATSAPATTAPEPEAAPTKQVAKTRVASAAKTTKRPRRRPVIVYEAVWCTPCHTLSAHLTRRGVRHLRRDIEKTPGAKEEMERKTASVGRPGAQLPVTDFRGRIIIGYDPATIDRLCDEDLAVESSG